MIFDWQLMYIELHARSAFSFLEGSSLPEELIGVCAHFHMPAMALLDADGLYGAPRFHLAANKIDLKAHIGAEVTCSPVILSGAGTSRSEVPAESKDPYPSVAAPERKGILTARPHPRGCVWDFGRTQEAATYILRRDRLPIRSNRTSTTQHVNRALAG